MATETLATYTLPDMHVKMYSDNVRMALQKKGGLVSPLFGQGSYVGSRIQVVSFIGPVEFVERTTRYKPTQFADVEHYQRWITGKEFDLAIPIDRLDLLKMIWDPSSIYVEAVRASAARKKDQMAIDAFFAVAKTGPDGNTDTSFPIADIIAHGGTNLTLAKLRLLRKMAKKRHVDLSTRPTLLVTAEQTDSLLAETTTSSIDFNAVKPLVDGEVTSFMGFNFIGFEEDKSGRGLPKDATDPTIRLLPMFTADAMHFGTWQELTITIDRRPDLNNIQQIHGTFTVGATRLEEGKVLQLQAKES